MLAGAAGCKPKPNTWINFDHPRVGQYLDQNVLLYYAHDKQPNVSQVLDHVSFVGRDTDCVAAAGQAIIQMQRNALDMGGNALVDLKPLPPPEGKKPTWNAQGFWCARATAYETGKDLTSNAWESGWEADVAIEGAPDGIEVFTEEGAAAEGGAPPEGGEQPPPPEEE